MGREEIEERISYGKLKPLTEEEKNRIIEENPLVKYGVEEMGGEIAGTREIISETQPENSSSDSD